MIMYSMMVVDDDLSMVELCERIFDSYRIISAGSIEECMEKLSDEKPDLIILDGKMPEKKYRSIIDPHAAYTLLGKIRALESYSAVPIIVVSANEGMNRALVIGAGANGYLKKPFDIELLESLVNKYLP